VRFRLVVSLAALLAAALLLPAVASAVRVHVRVEGMTRTLFGAAEPLLTPFTGALPVDGGAAVELSRPTPLGALEAASVATELYYRLTPTSFGPYVSQIGRYAGSGTSGWVFKVNGALPPVGADALVLEDGDRVLWYYATFGPAGGPPTLDLVRAGRGCYRAEAVDDTGARTVARRVVFHVDGRSVSSASGTLCPGRGWHALRATKQGAIRSELIRRR
jgi:hypothetical protein